MAFRRIETRSEFLNLGGIDPGFSIAPKIEDPRRKNGPVNIRQMTDQEHAMRGIRPFQTPMELPEEEQKRRRWWPEQFGPVPTLEEYQDIDQDMLNINQDMLDEPIGNFTMEEEDATDIARNLYPNDPSSQSMFFDNIKERYRIIPNIEHKIKNKPNSPTPVQKRQEETVQERQEEPLTLEDLVDITGYSHKTINGMKYLPNFPKPVRTDSGQDFYRREDLIKFIDELNFKIGRVLRRVANGI